MNLTSHYVNFLCSHVLKKSKIFYWNKREIILTSCKKTVFIIYSIIQGDKNIFKIKLKIKSSFSPIKFPLYLFNVFYKKFPFYLY